MRRNVTPTILLALNISQAARAFGTGLRSEHIRQLILEGKIVARMVGNRRLIAVADLQRWFESLPIAPVKPKTKRLVP
jgi:excisionase family DNA binding protein